MKDATAIIKDLEQKAARAKVELEFTRNQSKEVALRAEAELDAARKQLKERDEALRKAQALGAHRRARLLRVVDAVFDSDEEWEVGEEGELESEADGYRTLVASEAEDAFMMSPSPSGKKRKRVFEPQSRPPAKRKFLVSR